MSHNNHIIHKQYTIQSNAQTIHNAPKKYTANKEYVGCIQVVRGCGGRDLSWVSTHLSVHTIPLTCLCIAYFVPSSSIQVPVHPTNCPSVCLPVCLLWLSASIPLMFRCNASRQVSCNYTHIRSGAHSSIIVSAYSTSSLCIYWTVCPLQLSIQYVHLFAFTSHHLLSSLVSTHPLVYQIVSVFLLIKRLISS